MGCLHVLHATQTHNDMPIICAVFSPVTSPGCHVASITCNLELISQKPNQHSGFHLFLLQSQPMARTARSKSSYVFISVFVPFIRWDYTCFLAGKRILQLHVIHCMIYCSCYPRSCCNYHPLGVQASFDMLQVVGTLHDYSAI